MSLWTSVCGRTKRALQVRLNEHINNIRKAFKNHSVSKHYDLKHSRDHSNTLFLGIHKYCPHWRGSSLVREIYKQEIALVYRLKIYIPFGIHVDIEVNEFIKKS